MEIAKTRKHWKSCIIKCQGQGGRTKGFMSCQLAVKVVAGKIDQS